MAQLSYASSDAQTRKLFSKKLLVEALRDSPIGLFMGEMTEDPEAVICLKKEPQSAAGDTVTVSLQRQLSGDGVQGTTPLEGSEESMSEFTMAISLGELRHADKMEVKGMTPQRVQYDKDPRVRLKNALKDWWEERMATAFYNQVCGNTSTDIVGTKYTGENATVAADANHAFFGGAVATAELCAAATEAFSLTKIDRMVAAAKTFKLSDSNGVPLKPANIGGKKRYALVLHPYQVYDLRTSTTTGQWLDITKSLYMGKGEENPITKGLKGEFQIVGEYNGVLICQDPRIPKGQNSTTAAPVANTRRSVFLGAGALTAAFGMGYGSGQMDWVEKTFDYDKWLGIATGLVWGLKKTRFNSLDYGCMTLTTYTSLG